jgi:glycosyltransferase involved in cell wall biosynthesis
VNVLVIIPAYNEEASISHVINDLIKNCPNYDVLVINDGSVDNTTKITKGLNVKVIDLPYNLGIGGAVQAGYMYAYNNQYEVVVQFDGDGQHVAKEIKKIISPLKEGVADYVVGSRFINYEGFVSSSIRRLGISFLSNLIKKISGVGIKDVTSGFRAVNRPVIDYLSKGASWEYPEVEALVDIHKKQFCILEVPVRMKARYRGKSHLTYWKSIYYMIKVTLVLLFSSFRNFLNRKSGEKNLKSKT